MRKTHIVLGVHICRARSEQLDFRGRVGHRNGRAREDLALTIHPHPTLGETMMEAAEATLGHAIHIIQKPLKRARPTVRPGRTREDRGLGARRLRVRRR